MPEPQYYITTWDAEREQFTPQEGVGEGPHSLWGLRRAMRQLEQCAYMARRGPRNRSGGDPSVKIVKGA